MTPDELVVYLKSVASYIETTPKPSQRAVVAGLHRAFKEIHQAGKITKLVDRDLSTAMHGLEALIERLTKAARSINPQSESKAPLEHAVSNLQALKAGLSEEFQSLSMLEI
jgi:hypothetical protein